MPEGLWVGNQGSLIWLVGVGLADFVVVDPESGNFALAKRHALQPTSGPERRELADSFAPVKPASALARGTVVAPPIPAHDQVLALRLLARHAVSIVEDLDNGLVTPVLVERDLHPDVLRVGVPGI